MAGAARNALRAATRLYFRTSGHPAAEELTANGLEFESFDILYEQLPSFDEVYEEVVSRLLEAASAGDVSYAVPGHPLVAEETVRRLIPRVRKFEPEPGRMLKFPPLNPPRDPSYGDVDSEL